MRIQARNLLVVFPRGETEEEIETFIDKNLSGFDRKEYDHNGRVSILFKNDKPCQIWAKDLQTRGYEFYTGKEIDREIVNMTRRQNEPQPRVERVPVVDNKLEEKLDEMNENMRDFRAETEESFEEMRKELKEIRKENKELRNENKEIKELIKQLLNRKEPVATVERGGSAMRVSNRDMATSIPKENPIPEPEETVEEPVKSRSKSPEKARTSPKRDAPVREEPEKSAPKEAPKAKNPAKEAEAPAKEASKVYDKLKEILDDMCKERFGNSEIYDEKHNLRAINGSYKTFPDGRQYFYVYFRSNEKNDKGRYKEVSKSYPSHTFLTKQEAKDEFKRIIDEYIKNNTPK